MNPMVTLIQLNHGLGQFLRPRAVEYDSHPNAMTLSFRTG